MNTNVCSLTDCGAIIAPPTVICQEKILKEYELESNPNFNKLCDEQLRSGEIFTKMLTIEDSDSSIETKSLDELNEDELQEEVDELDEMDVSSKNKNLDSIDDDIDF